MRCDFSVTLLSYTIIQHIQLFQWLKNNVVFSVLFANENGIRLFCLCITKTLDFFHSKNVLNISKSGNHKIISVIQWTKYCHRTLWLKWFGDSTNALYSIKTSIRISRKVNRLKISYKGKLPLFLPSFIHLFLAAPFTSRSVQSTLMTDENYPFG